VHAAQQSLPARRGLGTKRALYYRIARTRQLIRAWEQVGTYISRANRRMTKQVEAADLVRQLTTIRHLLRRFPPLLGEVGQPGYFVIALARQEMIVQTFRTLLPDQRERLALDWKVGRDLLVAHRQFLRQELRGLRRKSRWARAVRAVRTLVNEQPHWLLIAVAVAAIAVTYWRSRP
jgi:hypothetical protein